MPQRPAQAIQRGLPTKVYAKFNEGSTVGAGRVGVRRENALSVTRTKVSQGALNQKRPIIDEHHFQIEQASLGLRSTTTHASRLHMAMPSRIRIGGEVIPNYGPGPPSGPAARCRRRPRSHKCVAANLRARSSLPDWRFTAITLEAPLRTAAWMNVQPDAVGVEDGGHIAKTDVGTVDIRSRR